MLPDWLPTTRQIAFWTALAAVWIAGGWLYVDSIVLADVDALSFEFAGRTFEMLAPEFVGLLLALPLFAVVARFSLSDLPGYQRGLNLGVRIFVVAAVVASLTQITATDYDSNVTTVYLVDTSASIPDDALEVAADHIDAAADRRGADDELHVLGFADRPYLIEPDDRGRYAELPRPDGEQTHDTDISAALQMAYGLFEDDHLRRVVLLSDGNQTRGDLLAEAHRASDFGVELHTQPMEFDRPPEVLIRDVDGPDHIEAGAPFELTARIESTHPDTVDLQLWRDEYRQQTRSVDVDEGITEVEFELEVSEPGFRQFQLEMDVHGADTHDENNRHVHTTWITGQPRILYIEGEMRARHHLQSALEEGDFDVDTRSPAGLPDSMDRLDEFELVILSDVHADDVDHRRMQLLDDWVRQRGGGLIKTGGENSFGAGGWEGTPVEELMPVSFEVRHHREEPGVAILLVIDRSSSMSEHRRMELAREAARAAVRELDDRAELGILAFDHGVTTVTPIQSVSNRSRILDQIDDIQIRGGTDIALALEKAYDNMAFHPASYRHVIMLTDGIAPEDDIFTETMPAMRTEDITVTTVAVGQGAETAMMRRVAEAGNGRFYYTARPDDIPRIFVDETRAAGPSALVEEPVDTRVVQPASVLQGISFEEAPYLRGYVSTTPRPGAEVLLETDRGEPLLARHRVGLGETVAFSSDVKNRWATDWLRWPGFPRLWNQLVRDTMRTDDTSRLPMEATIDRGRAEVVVDALGPDDEFINDLDSELEIVDPDGTTRQTSFDQTAPGRYRADFDVDELGAYELTGHHDHDGETFATSRASLSYPYPRGLAFTESDDQLLARAAEITGGDVDVSADRLFDPGDDEVPHRRHLWPHFALLAVLLLTLDLGLRRVRLGGDTEVSWQQLIESG